VFEYVINLEGLSHKNYQWSKWYAEERQKKWPFFTENWHVAVKLVLALEIDGTPFLCKYWQLACYILSEMPTLFIELACAINSHSAGMHNVEGA
jgi:hypothetical protein